MITFILILVCAVLILTFICLYDELRDKKWLEQRVKELEELCYDNSLCPECMYDSEDCECNTMTVSDCKPNPIHVDSGLSKLSMSYSQPEYCSTYFMPDREEDESKN